MHRSRMDLCHLICILCFLLVVSVLERVIGDSEQMIEVLQHWGQQRAEVQFFLRHDRAPGLDTGEKESEREVNRTGGLSKVTECVWVTVAILVAFLSVCSYTVHIFHFLMRMHYMPVPTCVYNTCVFFLAIFANALFFIFTF